jgi:hypothetical protein
MSKTADLDKTIDSLNEWLSAAKNTKDKLQIADRLIRALSLKYKHDTEGKGSRFTMPLEPTAPNGEATHAD